MSSIFGSNAQTNTQNSTGGGLFGNNPSSTQTGGGGLFGSNTNQGSGGGLFGSSTANNNATQPSGSLFGTNTAQSNTGGVFGNTNNSQNQSTGGGLFGAPASQPSTGGGLFGAPASQPSAGGGLFGAPASQPSTGGGLFGAPAAQPSAGGGLFGSTTNQAAPTSSVFGNQNNPNNANTTGPLFGNVSTNAPAQNTASQFASGVNANQNNNTSIFGARPSLFGNNSQPAAQPSIFGGNVSAVQPQVQPHQQQQQAPMASLYGHQSVSIGPGGHQLSPNQFQRLQYSGLSTIPNEKSIPEQIINVASKWDPDNERNLLKTYLYNAVEKAYAPFFYPNQSNGEDEKSWEEALSRKPEMPKVAASDSAGMAYVPTLCRGFLGLGTRVQAQIRAVQDMRTRLHEMNNSLNAVMEAHQQRITVKIASAQKQHQVLSQRCLRLAVKVQVLRNRGYALDGAEENLRKTLISLERTVMDPGFVGREDEIWARMVALRERARWLEEEGRKVAAQLEGQGQSGASGGGVTEDVLVKTRKILRDYDDQLAHLGSELEEIKGEFDEWSSMQQR